MKKQEEWAEGATQDGLKDQDRLIEGTRAWVRKQVG